MSKQEQVAFVDRTRAREAFEAYLAPFDTQDPRIALKVNHTYRVADLCAEIARDAGFTEAGCDLAWLCGLLHDLGRFEQLRGWNTFSDRASVSHAPLAESILFEDARMLAELGADERALTHNRAYGSIRAFVEDAQADELIRAAVGLHSLHALPDTLSARARAICSVVRDADKIDILRVACTDTAETVIGATEDELLASEVSPAAEDAFFEHRCVPYDEATTPADHVVGLACFAFELVYPKSLEVMDDQGYLYELFGKPFGITRPYTNPVTRMMIGRMDGHLRAWLDERLYE